MYSVLIKEMTFIYVAGTMHSVVIIGGVLISGVY